MILVKYFIIVYDGRVQDSLKERLITEDDFNWKLPNSIELKEEEVLLKFVGGVDISFSKEDPSLACGCLVVLDLQTLQLVYEDYSIHNLQVPYVPGFLAFREVSLTQLSHYCFFFIALLFNNFFSFSPF